MSFILCCAKKEQAVYSKRHGLEVAEFDKTQILAYIVTQSEKEVGFNWVLLCITYTNFCVITFKNQIKLKQEHYLNQTNQDIYRFRFLRLDCRYLLKNRFFDFFIIILPTLEHKPLFSFVFIKKIIKLVRLSRYSTFPILWMYLLQLLNMWPICNRTIRF